VFRTTTSTLVFSTNTMTTVLATELGITLPATAVITVKELHIYAVGNIDVSIAYAVDTYGATDSLSNIRFSDSSDAYFASVEVVYPVNCRPIFRSSDPTLELFTLTGAGTYVIDILASVSVPGSSAGRLRLPVRNAQLDRLVNALENLTPS